MASPRELVRTVAEVLGVPEATVVVHDRNLAVAGLRTKGGRGPSAAKMTPLDAANLLIAVAASSAVKDSVETVKAYADLISKIGYIDDRDGNRKAIPDGCWAVDNIHAPLLTDLRNKHTFREALSATIESYINGHLQSKSNYWLRPRITFYGPYPQAEIQLFNGQAWIETHRYSNIPTDRIELEKWTEKNKNNNEGDLKQIRWFDWYTIMIVGQTLKDEPIKDEPATDQKT